LALLAHPIQEQRVEVLTFAAPHLCAELVETPTPPTMNDTLWFVAEAMSVMAAG
jgi:hypothetical protein